LKEKPLRGEGLTEAASLLRSHFRGEEEEAYDELSGGWEPIRRTKPRDPEKARKAKTGHKSTSRQPSQPLTPARTEAAPALGPATFQRRETMRPTQQPKRGEFSAFGRAIYLARQIEDRNADTSELTHVVSQLEDKEKKSLVFRIQREVLFEGTCRLPVLFAVCKAAKLKADNGTRDMLGVAYASAAVYKALHEGGMSLEDMLAVGLATVNTFQTKEGKTVSRVEPRVSRETLQSATRQLRRRGKRAAAEILENYLLQGERRRAEARARREAKAGTPEPED